MRRVWNKKERRPAFLNRRPKREKNKKDGNVPKKRMPWWMDQMMEQFANQQVCTAIFTWNFNYFFFFCLGFHTFSKVSSAPCDWSSQLFDLKFKGSRISISLPIPPFSFTFPFLSLRKTNVLSVTNSRRLFSSQRKRSFGEKGRKCRCII